MAFFLCLLSAIQLFSKSIINEHQEQVLGAKTDEVKGFFIQLSNLHWSETYEKEPSYTLYISAKDKTTNEIIYENTYSKQKDDVIETIDQAFLVIPKANELEMTFQYEESSKHTFSNSTSVIIKPNQTIDIQIEKSGCPSLIMTLGADEPTYFNRNEPFDSINGISYFTHIPLDNRNYLLMTIKENVTGPQLLATYSEDRKKSDLSIGIEASKDSYTVTLVNVNYYNNTDNLNGSNFKFTATLNSSNQITSLTEKTFYLEKREYTSKELNIPDRFIKFYAPQENEPELTLKFTQISPKGEIITVYRTFTYSKLIENAGNDNICINCTDYGFSVTVKLEFLESTYFLIQPITLTEGNNVSVLMPITSINISNEGELEFVFPEGEKYSIMTLVNEDEKNFGKDIYITLGDLQPLMFITEEQSYTPSDDTDDVSIINWNSTSMSFIFTRDDAKGQTYKMRYILSDDRESALKYFEDESGKKTNWKKLLKIVIIVLIVCVIISILISICCCISKRKKRSRSDNGLLDL